MMHLQASRIVAAVVTAAVLVTAGCGSASQANPVAKAAQVTQQQAGAQVRLTQAVALAGEQKPITVTGSGFVNLRQGSGRLVLDISSVPGIAQLGGAAETVLYRSGRVYVNVPFLAKLLPAGKRWIELNVQDAESSIGLKPSGVAPGGGDPSQYLGYLTAGAEARKAGAATLYGVRTTRYDVTVPLKGIADRVPAADRAAAEAVVSHVAGGTGMLAAQVWIDADGRVRRERLVLHLRLGAGIPVSLDTLTLDFVRFGPVPAVMPPPPGALIDATSQAIAAIHAGDQ